MIKDFILLLFVAMLTGCAVVDVTAGKSVEIVLLHTNDSHGVILPENGMGGLAERGSFIESVRADNANVLLLDAGDLNTRGLGQSVLSNWQLNVTAYNIMGYDAMAFGNHDFDKGLSLLDEQIRIAEFPFLSANVKGADGEYIGTPWIIKEYDGVRVGIFGLTTPYFNNESGEIIFIDPVESAKEAVNYLRNTEKCDIVIALVHLGLDESGRHSGTIELAESISGVDLIVDGHSEDQIEAPLIINGVPVVTAFHYGQYVGEAHIMVTNGRLSAFSWRPVAIDGHFAAEPKVAALVMPFKAEYEMAMAEQLAVAEADFEQNFKASLNGETAAGDLVTDATVWYIRNILHKKADFAFTNGATLRVGPKKGKLTGQDAFNLLPFENNIMLIDMKGSDVTALFEFIASQAPGSRAWAQVSADVRYTIDYTGESGVLKGLTIGGRPVSAEKVYTVLANDFITSGGAGYKIVGNVHDTGINTRTAVTEYMKRMGILTPATDGRVTVE